MAAIGLVGACWEFRVALTGVEVRELRCDRRDAGVDMMFVGWLSVVAKWSSSRLDEINQVLSTLRKHQNARKSCFTVAKPHFLAFRVQWLLASFQSMPRAHTSLSIYNVTVPTTATTLLAYFDQPPENVLDFLQALDLPLG